MFSSSLFQLRNEHYELEHKTDKRTSLNMQNEWFQAASITQHRIVIVAIIASLTVLVACVPKDITHAFTRGIQTMLLKRRNSEWLM